MYRSYLLSPRSFLHLSVTPFHLYFHFFFLKPRQIGFEHVGFRRFPPVNPSVDEGGGDGEVLVWVPNVEREWVEHVVTASVAEEAWNQRHFEKTVRQLMFECLLILRTACLRAVSEVKWVFIVVCGGF